MAGTAEGDLPCLRLNSVNKSLFYYLYTQEILNEVLEHTIKCFRELVDLLANRPSPSDRISRISDPTLTETNFSDQKTSCCQGNTSWPSKKRAKNNVYECSPENNTRSKETRHAETHKYIKANSSVTQFS